MKNSQDNYYKENYESLLNKGILGSFKNITHKFIERNFTKQTGFKILELGAGKGYHKKFVHGNYDSYIESDLRTYPQSDIIAVDAEDLSKFRENQFDRIIATCLVAHLNDPTRALHEWRRCTKSGGVISIYVPCEPGIALRLFRFFSTNLKSRTLNINHYQFHYLEHRNYYINLKYIINEIFGNDEITKRGFPFRFGTWNINFFVVYEVRIAKP